MPNDCAGRLDVTGLDVTLMQAVAWVCPELRIVSTTAPAGQRVVVPLPLEPERDWVIGRGADADIRIDDDSVSRRHARLTVRGGRVLITDLHSTWRTLVDGQPIAPGSGVALPARCRIQLGLTQLEYHSPLEQALAEAPAPPAPAAPESVPAPTPLPPADAERSHRHRERSPSRAHAGRALQQPLAAATPTTSASLPRIPADLALLISGVSLALALLGWFLYVEVLLPGELS